MALTIQVFEQILNTLNLQMDKKWGVAVSGGADSLCLTLLLSDFCQKKNISLTAITVNHNIREESAVEAEAVHAFLENLGVVHQVIHNQQKIGQHGVEKEAREIRYNLLTDFCKQKKIDYLFVAHQMEDQAETFLSRLARGSGVDGLSSMKSVFKRNGIEIIRPFLDVSKKEITDWLISHNYNWVEDPMNQDETYERVKWRRFLPVLNEKGIAPKAIVSSAKRLTRAQVALQYYTDEFLSKSVTYFDEGYALIHTDIFMSAPEEVKIRALFSVLKSIGQTENFISLELVERAVYSFPKKMTLAHCVLVPHKKGVFVVKEAHKMEDRKTVIPNRWIKWDRFEVFSDVAGVIQAGLPLKRRKNIPYLVQKSFPFFEMEKELENNQEIRYKDSLKPNIKIKFIKES